MQSIVKKSAMVSPFLLFFLIHSSQTGIGVLLYQSQIIKGAGQDAWVSILFVGFSLHFIILAMVHILKNSSHGDIISFHKDSFGKILGGCLNLLLSIYFFTLALLVMHSYIEMLQIWVFDGIPSWELSLILCFLVYYVVSGGFRSVTGIAFWGVVIPSGLLASLVYLMTYAEPSYMMPIFNHSISQYALSARESVIMFFGIGTFLIYYPFIKNKQTSSKWAHYGLFYTTCLYVFITIITFMFFTQGKLHHLSWPTLTMIKVISFPFLERFEFIFIFTWLLVIMPVICLNIWSATRIIKRTFPRVKATNILLLFLCGIFLYNSILVDVIFTQKLNQVIENSGLIFTYGYIPFLYFISLLRSKMKNRNPKQQRSESNNAG